MPLVRAERHDAYRGWVETAILQPLLPANSDIVDAIAEQIAGEIERVSRDFDADTSDAAG
jgi:hypothetical protein